MLNSELLDTPTDVSHFHQIVLLKPENPWRLGIHTALP
jgi:hypothetical protein